MRNDSVQHTLHVSCGGVEIKAFHLRLKIAGSVPADRGAGTNFYWKDRLLPSLPSPIFSVLPSLSLRSKPLKYS